MRTLIRIWLIWSIVWVVLLVVAYLASQGEPVCEGPLILGADDSDPPQCDDPVAALPKVGGTLFAVGFVVSTMIAAVVIGVQARRAPKNLEPRVESDSRQH